MQYLKLTKTKFVCEQQTWNIHGTNNITVWGSTVQYNQVIKLRLFVTFYPRPLRERESTDGHFLLLLQLFPTSNIVVPTWLKKTQVLFPPVTRDQPDMT